jgi:hypothetical protein
MELYSGVTLWWYESLHITKKDNKDHDDKQKYRFLLFIDLKILPQPSLYIYHLILFVNKNNELYTTNNKIHNYCTRQR